jgi:hypothetical protein
MGCNNRSAYTERPTPALVEEETPFLNTYMSRKEIKSESWISWSVKPEMTVLANPAAI